MQKHVRDGQATLNCGRVTFYAKGPPPLLWAHMWAARGKIA